MFDDIRRLRQGYAGRKFRLQSGYRTAASEQRGTLFIRASGFELSVLFSRQPPGIPCSDTDLIPESAEEGLWTS